MLCPLSYERARTGRPSLCFNEHTHLQALVGMSLYDVLLVNPVADGTNMAAKEGPVVNRRDGALERSSPTP